MAFKIIKRGANDFWHNNNSLKEVNLSDWEIILEAVGQTVVLGAKNGANFPQKAVGILDVIVIDETASSIEETFTNVEDLRLRLVALGYNPYIVANGGIQSIVAGTNVTVDNTDPQNPIVSASGGGGSTPNLEEVLIEGNNAFNQSIVLLNTLTADVYTEYSSNGIELNDSDNNVSVGVNKEQIVIGNADSDIRLVPSGFLYQDSGGGFLPIKFEAQNNLGGELFVKAVGATDEQIAFVSDIPAPLGFTPEDVANKTDTMAGNTASSTKYLSAKGVYDYIVSLAYLTIASASATYQAILTDVNFGSFANGLTAKTTPLDADLINIVDTADSNKQKKVTFTNVKAFLKTYFDTLFVPKSRYVFQGKTSITGVTVETVIFSFKIPAAAYDASDSFSFDMTGLKSVTAGTVEYKTYIGTTANALTTQIGRVIANATTRAFDYSRTYHLDSGTLDCSIGFTTNALTGFTQTTSVNTPATANRANDIWITVTGTPGVVSEVVGIMSASIIPLK